MERSLSSSLAVEDESKAETCTTAIGPLQLVALVGSGVEEGEALDFLMPRLLLGNEIDRGLGLLAKEPLLGPLLDCQFIQGGFGVAIVCLDLATPLAPLAERLALEALEGGGTYSASERSSSSSSSTSNSLLFLIVR